MVIYYSKGGHTLTYAKAIGELNNQELFELKPSGKINPLMGMVDVLRSKSAQVTQLPQTTNDDDIYICSPVWVSKFATPVQYFLENSDLKGKNVTAILTCGTLKESYKKNAIKALEATGCNIIDVTVFVVRTKSNTTVEDAKEFINMTKE